MQRSLQQISAWLDSLPAEVRYPELVAEREAKFGEPVKPVTKEDLEDDILF
jgi:hypothetical protein